MSKKKQSKEEKQLSILEWCDAMVAKGHELSLTWDGGNDSGWVEFKIDGENPEEENQYTEALINYCYDTLDYGSWAGDFSASGEAIYDPKEKAFIGLDNYSTEEVVNEDIKVFLRVPKDVWFDGLSIQVEESQGSVYKEGVEVELLVQNGFTTDRHAKVASEIATAVIEAFDRELDEDDECNMFADHTYRSTDFEKDPETGDMVAWMQPVSKRVSEVDEKDIYISVEDLELNLD
jgi:hypothetical protein